ncbi:MAG: DUF1223 domain-containing protein [Gammaproteobacteria bacterium]|nr:DUF1223 domain-containing protein [Gammaproteobacteria bacterium]
MRLFEFTKDFGKSYNGQFSKYCFMKMPRQSILLSLILVISQSVIAQEIQFTSGEKQVSLVELYTSQGCSSCPPADTWLSELKNEPGLWTEFVPVAFHVSYWDYLGWKDRFSKKEHSSRQRLHKNQGHVKVVYTPGFFLNGKEWKKRFRLGVPTFGNEVPGIISATLDEQNLKVRYSPSQNITQTTLNVAILGFGYQSPIKSGENSNRVLNEDFVLLSHLKKAGANNSWEIELPKKVSPMAERYGLAIWVSQGGDLTPLQATGGWLPKNYFR